ncbi:hypothetical protein PT974_09637 [Cladobotryum mycophilum]|uniref:F-box domain-containing protein n=1 Tax=Cladobotryum mycophilum TaxID=491253 RepID=A0ABR0SI16_9HYPO
MAVDPAIVDSSQRRTITRLPLELLFSIVSNLPNRDIKNVRQTCRFLYSLASLRIDRVSISANLLNIKVFREIANDETYRCRITEIVSDGVRLEEQRQEPGGCEEWEDYGNSEEVEESGVAFGFIKDCKDDLRNVAWRKREGLTDLSHHKHREHFVVEIFLKEVLGTLSAA